jgi:hypothetical protein
MPGTQAMNRDLEHLKLLVTFHYIVAAITAVCSSFPLIHVFIGLMFMLNPHGFAGSGKQAFPARMFGLIFFVIGGAIVLFGWTLAAVTAYAGRCISRREKYTFCLIAAGFNCMYMPIGTILGVFTLIVLTRDSVRLLFKARSDAVRSEH